MDNIKDKSIHLTAEKIAEEIKSLNTYSDFYTDLQVTILLIILTA